MNDTLLAWSGPLGDSAVASDVADAVGVDLYEGVIADESNIQGGCRSQEAAVSHLFHGFT